MEFCKEPKSTKEIAAMLGYKERKSAARYIRPLLEKGRIAMTIPDKPNSQNQKYITIKKEEPTYFLFKLGTITQPE